MLAHASYLTDPRIRREAEALAENGYQVHVISLAEVRQGKAEPREATVKGVHIHRLPVIRKRGNFARYIYEYSMVGILGAIKLALLQFQGKIDVVHVHNMPDILVLAALVPRLCGSRLVLDIHDPSPELYMSWNHDQGNLVVRVLRLQEKVSCWLADRVVSVNDTMRENLSKKGVPAEKISIIHNFPDQGYFQICDTPATWPKDPRRLDLLYCGTVTEHYDLGLAIKAMAMVKDEVPVRLKIMGDGNKLSEVLDLATKLGVRESVELVGKVPVEKVADEMKKSDIGLSCHRAGIFGDLYFSTKILEYLTQGLCVISPRTYTIHKYLPDDCVFYFEPGDVDMMAENLRQAWRKPAEVLKRLSNAKQHLSRLSWQAEKADFINFYQTLLNRVPAPAVFQKTN
jgi:glycosyltransferase involved in cell wall biosynthesis